MSRKIPERPGADKQQDLHRRMARIALRAEARNYTECADEDEDESTQLGYDRADRKLRLAAISYARSLVLGNADAPRVLGTLDTLASAIAAEPGPR